MKSSFFAYLSRMKLIRRWSLMRNIQPENIEEHSYQVAIIAHALCVIDQVYFNGCCDVKEVVLLALYHDAGEVIVGDLPTPVKYHNPQIKLAYGEVEDVAREKLLSMLPEQMQNSYRPLLMEKGGERELRFVKAADKLAAYLKCMEELSAGNREFIQAEKSIRRELDKFNDLPAVAWFIEHCSGAFSCTLDELN